MFFLEITEIRSYIAAKKFGVVYVAITKSILCINTTAINFDFKLTYQMPIRDQ